MKPLRVKRVDSIAPAVVRLVTSVPCLNCFGPACWLSGAAKWGAGVISVSCRRIISSSIRCLGSEATGRILPYGSVWFSLLWIPVMLSWLGYMGLWGCASPRTSLYGSTRPVLKHGPRSLTCARVLWWKTIRHREIKRRDPLLAHLRLHLIFCEKSSKSV